MRSTLCDLRDKEIVNIKNGCCLGCPNDIEIDIECANVLALIVHGRPKCFGLLGREDDIVIPWNCIRVIGEDTILVEHEFCKRKKPIRQKWLSELFRW